MRLLRNAPPSVQSASIAQVSFSDSFGFGAVGSFEARDIPVFAPRGISYRPCEGDRLLMFSVDGVETCVGCLSVQSGVDGGELRLTSSGGACLHLKNNGEISLNGLIITKDGKLIEQDGGAPDGHIAG